MEFPFDINNLFGDEISIVTSDMKPYRNVPGSQEHKQQMQKVVDQMGIASSKAQGLDRVITSAVRFGCSDHRLYVIKDAHANDGKGAVVGILKMGNRKLFVYDNMNNQHEMDPLCVLDFYVHESRQRTGMGKRLYEFMLQAENVRPAHLAIDRPSVKFQGFMQKHYNLKAKIPQVNNFVIYDGFFRERPKAARVRRQRHRFFRYPPLRDSGNGRGGPNGRLPPISMEKQKELLTNVQPRVTSVGSRQAGDMDGSSMLAGQQSGYSRHLTSAAAPPQMDLRQPHQQQQSKIDEPPMLRRDGPSPDFVNLTRGAQHRHPTAVPLTHKGAVSNSAGFSSDTTLQSGGAHQSPVKQNTSFGNFNLPPADPYTTHSAKKTGQDTTWNVFGVPSGATAGARKMQHTRLW